MKCSREKQKYNDTSREILKKDFKLMRLEHSTSVFNGSDTGAE